MSKSQIVRLGILSLALAGAVVFKLTYVPTYDGQDEPYDVIYGKVADPVSVNVERKPADPAAVHGIGRDRWEAPRSAWLDNERALAQTTLLNSEIDLLVVPLQGDKNAFDPIERALITRLVSQSVADSKRFTVANPSAVMRYLGMNRTQYPIKEVDSLARLARAKTVLIMESEHDRQGRWYLNATLYDPSINKSKDTRIWRDLEYSADRPPVFALAEILDEVAEFASGRGSRVNARRAKFDPEQFQFPVSVTQAIEQSRTTPIAAAAHLQLLGMLHPRGEYNGIRNQLFERSFVELAKASDGSDYHKYFQARALAYLGRRKAAVNLLTEPLNTHETALLNALNGNLPALREYVADSGTTPLDFMVLKDMQFVESRYLDRLDRDYVEAFATDNLPWAPMIYRSLMEYENWSSPATAYIKVNLEDLMPVEGGSLEAYIDGQTIIGEYPDELDLLRQLWGHINAILTPERLRNQRNIENHTLLTEVDIAEIAKAIAVSDHLREVNEDLEKRGLPESALRTIAEFEPIFSGHPEVTLTKAHALWEQAQDVQGAERQTLTRKYLEAQLNGFSWSTYLSAKAVDVARNYSLTLARVSPSTARAYSGTGFAGYSRRFYEWPKGEVWFRRFNPREIRSGALDECLEVTWTRFACLGAKIEAAAKFGHEPQLIRDELLARHADRFIGNPRRAEFNVMFERKFGDGDVELRILQEQVDAGSVSWNIYEALGRIHKRRGNYAAAQRTWLSYPGFNTNDGRVSVGDSQNADFAASQFFWIGQHELALPLLRIAAESGTGSSGSMASAQRLALIAGDLELARDWAAERVRRYQSKYGARDLMELLHATGESSYAWKLFEQMHVSWREPEIWSSALVGHRLESASIESIAEWISVSTFSNDSDPAARGSGGAMDLAPRYLLLAGQLDRTPGLEFPSLVSGAYSRPGSQRRPRDLPELVAGNSDAEKAIAAFEDAEIVHVYPRLATGMSAFLRGDYEGAYNTFLYAASFRDLNEYISYYAFSAAELGRQSHLQAILDARLSQYRERLRNERVGGEGLGEFFDDYLAFAVLAAYNKQHDDAIRYLRLALDDRPFLGRRTVYPMYQLVDLADRLFEKTGVQSYREFALDLSRRHTIILPMHAWAYFVVAKHSEASLERIRAAASGLHLDPLSERGSKLPKNVLDEARTLLEKSGPPYLRRTEKDLSQST